MSPNRPTVGPDQPTGISGKSWRCPQRRQTFAFGSGVPCRRTHECHPKRHFHGLLMSLDATPGRPDKADAHSTSSAPVGRITKRVNVSSSGGAR
jgi:hypothetical protein